MDQCLEGSIELSPVKTYRLGALMKYMFSNLPQSVQVREEVWGQLIWLHSYLSQSSDGHHIHSENT